MDKTRKANMGIGMTTKMTTMMTLLFFLGNIAFVHPFAIARNVNAVADLTLQHKNSPFELTLTDDNPSFELTITNDNLSTLLNIKDDQPSFDLTVKDENPSSDLTIHNSNPLSDLTIKDDNPSSSDLTILGDNSSPSLGVSGSNSSEDDSTYPPKRELAELTKEIEKRAEEWLREQESREIQDQLNVLERKTRAQEIQKRGKDDKGKAKGKATAQAKPKAKIAKGKATAQAKPEAKGSATVAKAKAKASPGDKYDKLREGLAETASDKVQQEYLDRLDKIFKAQSLKPIPSPLESNQVTNKDSRTFYTLTLTNTEYTNKELFQALSQHRQYDQTKDAGLLVKTNIGGRPVEFVTMPSEWSTIFYYKKTRNQVGIFTKLSSGEFRAVPYKAIGSAMNAAARTDAARLKIYQAMHDAIDRKPQSQGSLFSDAFENTPKGKDAQEAAVDLLLISEIAEAVPPMHQGDGRASGRTPGSDKLFRSFLMMEIDNGGKRTFTNFIKQLPFSCGGGTALMRKASDAGLASGKLDTQLKRKKVGHKDLGTAGENMSPVDPDEESQEPCLSEE